MTIDLTIRDESYAMALAQFCKRLSYEDFYRKADGCYGKEHQKAVADKFYGALFDLEKSLKDAGFCPR